jgi:hypothetical protein
MAKRSHASYVRASRRGWVQRETKHVKLIDHILTVQVESPRRGGKPGRTTTRDLIVPARPGTRKAELLWLTHNRISDLPKKEQYMEYILTASERQKKKIGLYKHAGIGGKITIAEGPVTRGKKIKLR